MYGLFAILIGLATSPWGLLLVDPINDYLWPIAGRPIAFLAAYMITLTFIFIGCFLSASFYCFAFASRRQPQHSP